MPSKGSVTSLLAPVKAGDPAAVQQLWERYFERLVGLARKKHLGAAPPGGDEQDMALSASRQLLPKRRARSLPKAGRPRRPVAAAGDHQSCEAARLLRDERHEPRAPGGEATPDLEQLLCREPAPEAAVKMADGCGRLLDSLSDRKLEQIAVRRMEGLMVEKIAVRTAVRAPHDGVPAEGPLTGRVCASGAHELDEGIGVGVFYGAHDLGWGATWP
jgi:hypothetical protein